MHRLTHPIRRGWRRARWFNRVLYPLSLMYAALMRLRSAAYRAGILHCHRITVPVVVVGNLSVGGVGKTPLVMALVDDFKRRGMSPGIITRGYHGRVRQPSLVTENSTAEQVGDEPLLMFRRCNVTVMVSPDRVRGARLLSDECGCDVIVSDDGFQHHKLARDVDIVVLDERQFGNGWCLPAGPLREPPAAIARADVVVVNNAPATRGQFAMRTVINRAVKMDGGESLPLTEFAHHTVHAIAAIGNRNNFFRQLAAFNIKLREHPFPDHHHFTAAELAFVTVTDTVFTTEKDAVKLETVLPPEIRARCWVVPLEVTLPDDFFATVLNKLPNQ